MNSSTAPWFSIVVPVRNELGNLRQLHAELTTALDALTSLGLRAAASAEQVGRADYEHEGSAHNNDCWEIVWVDDWSDDGSWELLGNLAREDSRSRALRLPDHLGQSAAIWHGLNEARGSFIATIDSDLQNDPADLLELFSHLTENDLDLVSGVRAERHDGRLRLFASRVANRVRRWVLGDHFQDVGCSLKIYRAEFLTAIPLFDGLHRFLPILALWNGAHCGEVTVAQRPRLHGYSKYGAIRGRLGRGVGDLLGVLWLRRRWLGRSFLAKR